MDTLPDLRVTIAESMEALAEVVASRPGHFIAEDIKALRLIDGAETLRWCAEREAPSYEEMRLELDASFEREEEFEEKLVELRRAIEDAAPKIKPAALRDRLLAAVRDV